MNTFCNLIFLRTLALTNLFIWANSLIMNKTKYSIQALEEFLRHHKIAIFDQLKAALGNPARCTIFRKLAELEYLSSYSHRGKFYTLSSIARFSALGLWNYQSVWFSRFGNLLDTAEALVQEAEAGYTAAELKDVLHVKTKHALAQLARSGRLKREQFESIYVYLSGQSHIADRQRKARKVHLKRSFASLIVVNPDLAEEEAKATVLLFLSALNERQRRLYAGLESLKLGYGGDSHIANLFGMDPHTVARGRRDLEKRRLGYGRLRAEGGGRATGKKTPAIIDTIAAIMEHETAGDPVSGCKWTRKTTLKIAQQLNRAGIRVSPNTVGKLLKNMNFSLRVNLKTLESGLRKPPDPRDTGPAVSLYSKTDR